MELGKDLLSIAPDGVPCAYQLKTAMNGRLGLSVWRHDVVAQIHDLVCGRIVHPSIPRDAPHHRAYLVTNGKIEEEVVRAIQDMNASWQHQGLDWELKTIVRGEMLGMAQELGASLWPTEPFNVKTFLDVYFFDGRACLPKHLLCTLLDEVFGLGSSEDISQANCRRRMASAALLCASATSAFQTERNHVATIEAWVLYVAYVHCLAGRHGLPSAGFSAEVALACSAIRDALEDLVDEIGEREHLYEGDLKFDGGFLRPRVTKVMALISALGLWLMRSGSRDDDRVDSLRDLFLKNTRHLLLWGEAATPELLACFWFWRAVVGDVAPEAHLRHLAMGIVERNQPGQENPLTSPYYSIDHKLRMDLGLPMDSEGSEHEDSFAGRSYTLQGVVYLLARLRWKQTLKNLWPEITHIDWVTFRPDQQEDFWRWSVSAGGYELRNPTMTQDWSRLLAEASRDCEDAIPAAVRADPVLLLLFTLVCPFRLNSEVVRWLDTKLRLEL
jgi:hypothetical protein